MFATIQVTPYHSVWLDADIGMSASQVTLYLIIGKLAVNQAELSVSAPRLLPILSHFEATYVFRKDDRPQVLGAGLQDWMLHFLFDRRA